MKMTNNPREAAAAAREKKKQIGNKYAHISTSCRSRKYFVSNSRTKAWIIKDWILSLGLKRSIFSEHRHGKSKFEALEKNPAHFARYFFGISGDSHANASGNSLKNAIWMQPSSWSAGDVWDDEFLTDSKNGKMEFPNLFFSPQHESIFYLLVYSAALGPFVSSTHGDKWVSNYPPHTTLRCSTWKSLDKYNKKQLPT